MKYHELLEQASVNIAACIKREIERLGISPEKINDGSCHSFADKIVTALGGKTLRLFSGCPRDEISMIRSGQTYDPTAPLHYFIICDGRCYDAETPTGVDRWQELPFFKRHSW